MSSAAPWLDIARAELGVKEIKGKAATARIREYFAAAGSPGVISDETAWCSAFANFVMARAGYRGTQSLAARSWLNWGHACKPQPGAILIFRRGTSLWQGHVTFMLSEDATHYTCIGGNQGDKVSISRYPKQNLLGARWPAQMRTSYGARGGVAALAGFVGSQANAIAGQFDLAATLPAFERYVDLFAMASFVLGLLGAGYMLWREYKNIARANTPDAPDDDDQEDDGTARRPARRHGSA